MPANGRFGGHIVSGHIDGTGIITEIKRDDNATIYTIKAGSLMKYIVEKGSVAIDGISLTVTDATMEHFKVSIIPHTAFFTILSEKKVGDTVNLENDIIGKYVEKLIAFENQEKPKSNISREFLTKFGY
jgi:riboflavin synthase